MAKAKQCGANRADGSPCGAHALEDGTGMCLWHSERYKATRLENAAKGGRKPHVDLPRADKLTPERAREFIARLSAALIDGSLDSNTARSLTYMLQVDRQLRDSEAVERRMTQLEAQIAAIDGGRAVPSGPASTESLQEKRDRILGHG